MTVASTPPNPPGRLARIWDSDIAWSFRSSPVTVVATVLALLLVAAAVAAPLIAPYDPFDPASLDLSDGFSRPMVPNEITGKVFWL
ncbi:MAG: ABC transporter permease, partial [Bosea sp. (in: a-proteobacteria)]|nr:ABC transporter permease [Bosea sp. (in: a-proteobacteria)]